MSCTRVYRAACPWGSFAKCVIFAPVNSIAAPLGHAATQAPQPMQIAASIASSASSGLIGFALGSGFGPESTPV